MSSRGFIFSFTHRQIKRKRQKKTTGRLGWKKKLSLQKKISSFFISKDFDKYKHVAGFQAAYSKGKIWKGENTWLLTVSMIIYLPANTQRYTTIIYWTANGLCQSMLQPISTEHSIGNFQSEIRGRNTARSYLELITFDANEQHCIF